MSFSFIVAVSKNGVIGVDNKLPWNLSNDLKYFKSKTTGKNVIMGRKTFDSIGKPLPNRENYILTRERNYQQEGCHVYHSIDEIMKYLPVDKENIVIGGGEVYKLFSPYVDKIYLTKVDLVIEGDAFFEVPKGFIVTEEEKHYDENQGIHYSFVTMEKV
ncbi:dihydrofolate reductase [Cytobacillus sp. IB215665]|uniref:dihydrofolate reductase n=1 Tax=Cytobacillus sp. IB215665 TaxID=3097357 RepID=UPI002A0FD948|nr:dihydrofolate reductase [Cytobacillus sp. IB215665]MDX8364559.1 dihydrofolate reductase [Cytobacillus sp. IB215665]